MTNSIKRYRERNKDYIKKYNARNHTQNFSKIKDRKLKKAFGISLSEYNEMLIKQDLVCAICQNPELEINKKTNKSVDLAVDHCHKTGKIRGLLCNKCNKAIGLFQENSTFLKAAIDYLNQ